MGRFLIIWLSGMLALGELAAQPASPPAGPARAAAGPPAPPPPARSPVEHFRELVAMSPAERAANLAGRSAQSRAFLEAKLKEFDAMTPGAREARFQTLQLRWHLLPLMKTAPADRTSRLAALPEFDRKLVEERLEQWDLLTPDLQRKVLENENVIRLFFRSETNPPSAQPASANPGTASPGRLDQEQARWNSLPEQERQNILAQFERYFELSAREKARIMDRMGEAERRQMEAALQRFARLPKDQRERCLRGFEKFADLTPAEKQEFLGNAERWQSMTPQDRQLWRDLVSRLHPTPPLPPRVRPRPPPSPPAVAPTDTPRSRPSANTSGIATN